jgi:hypothetical protein
MCGTKPYFEKELERPREEKHYDGRQASDVTD